ncbi:hypothetical protein J4438_01590 [Candidatus Woesearchaeota archaeon]|nr:hypothetical protein [Candidatus Woesearchaeota archaeon]
MLNKKGDEIIASLFSMIFIVIILALVVIFSILGGKDSELEIGEFSYGNENIFVIESYLETNSDIVNLYLIDEEKKDELELQTKNIFDKVYGKCYGFEISNLKINELTNKKTCVDYPIDNKLCLDISEYDKKMEDNEVAKCFE